MIRITLNPTSHAAANMKTITAIYLNCKPELRDEWLAAIDIDSEVEESNVGRLAVSSQTPQSSPFYF